MSTDEQDFVAASTAARDAAKAKERRNTRRLHRLVAGVSAALVVALLAGAVAVAQRNEAKDQRNQATEEARNADIGRMAFQARSLAESNPSQALLLALEADRLRPDADTLGSLEVTLLANPALVRTVHTEAPFTISQISADGTSVSGGTTDGRVVQVDLANGAILREWRVGDGPVIGGLGPSGGIALPLNSTQVLSRGEDGAVQVLVSDGLVARVIRIPPIAVPPTANPSTIAVGTATGIRLVDLRNGSVLRTIESPPAQFLAFSGDGTRLAIETGDGPVVVTLVDAATGKSIAPPVTLPWPAGLALNKTGTRLGVGSFTGGDARVVDVATGETLGTPLEANQFLVAFSGDGSLMGAVSLSGTVRVFDAATGEQVGADRTLPFGGPSGLGFTPDNQTLVVAGKGGEIAVLDLVGRQKLAASRRDDRLARHVLPRRRDVCRPDRWFRQRHRDRRRRNGQASADGAPSPKLPELGNPGLTRSLRGGLQSGRRRTRDWFRRVRRPAGRD